jgi:hypothetical protein
MIERLPLAKGLLLMLMLSRALSTVAGLGGIDEV